MIEKTILMIQPWIFDLAAYDLWIKPLGLLYLASVLEEMGFTVKYLDCLNPDHDWMKGKLKRMQDGRGKFFREEIEKPQAYKTIPRRYCRYGLPETVVVEEILKAGKLDAIFVTSMMTYWYPAVKRVIEICREHVPGVPVVLGGVYASLMPEHAQAVVRPDIVVQGAGEYQLEGIIEQLFPGMSGLKAQSTEKFKTEEPDKRYYPAWHLTKNLSYLPLLTSRGCPYRCSYCATHKLYPGFVQRNWEDVLNEILFFYEQYRFKDITFYDDALLYNGKNHILKLLHDLKKQGFVFRFHTPNGLNARFIDAEMADAMYEAKFETVRISLETADENSLRIHGYKVSRKEFKSAMEMLFAAGYKPGEIGVYLLAGMPGQSIEEVKNSIQFVHELGGVVKLSLYSPIPGTADFNKLPVDVQRKLRDEPLLQNCSIFPLFFNYIGWSEYEKIKLWIDTLNASIGGKDDR